MIELRAVRDADLAILFGQQNDPEANRMAALPARDEAAFRAHWKEKVFADPSATTRAVWFDGRLAGHLVTWIKDGRRMVGYWLGRDYWGKGIASAALPEFLRIVGDRPLYAFVARHNRGSIRVLEKSGFRVHSSGRSFSKVHGEEIEDLTFVLD